MNKKVLGLISVCTMLLSLCMQAPSLAAGMITFAGNEVLAEGGFYDNTPDSEAVAPESGAKDGSVILTHGEWVKYDVSSLIEGTYKVSLNYALDIEGYKDFVYLDVLADGVLLERRKAEDTDAAFKDADFCNIYIGEETKELCIRNSSQRITPENVNGDYIPTIDIASITLTLVSVNDKSDGIITSNAAQNILNQVSGDGFFDENGGEDYNSNDTTANLANKVVTSAWQAVGDYGKYDISELKAGAYKLTLKAGTRINGSKLNVYVDEEKVVDAATLIYDATTTGVLDDGTETVNDLGQILIPQGVKVLKLENAAGHIYAGDFTLEYVGDEIVYEEKTINVLSVLGGNTTSGEGTGYHDTIRQDGSLEIASGRYVVARQGKWLKYDVTGLKGYYKVGMYATGSNGGTIKGVNYYVNDGGAQKVTTDITFTDAYTTYELRDLGVVKLSGGENQTLKIEFGSLTGASYVEYFYLEKVSIFDIERKAVTFNVADAKEYYDTGAQGYIRDNTEFVLHATEWLSFSQDGLWGAYNVTMNASGGATSTISKVDFTVDEKTETQSTSIAFEGYGTYKTYNLGTVVFDANESHTIKIAPQISGASYVKSFTLTPCEVTKKEIASPNVSAGGEGVGFHDLTGNLSLVNGGKDVAFSNTEWVKYDASFLDGIYKLSMEASGNVGGRILKAVLSADGETIGDFPQDISFTGYSEFNDYDLGYVSFDGKAEQSFTVQFMLTGASYVRKFTLERVDNSAVYGEFADTNGAKITELAEESKAIKANVVLANTSEDASVYVVVAKYEGTKLISAAPEFKEIKKGEVAVISKNVDVIKGQTVKIMVWNVENGQTTMIPVCENAVIS